jgi:peptidoglycan/LPS O-acetylase OafA/YrhL
MTTHLYPYLLAFQPEALANEIPGACVKRSTESTSRLDLIDGARSIAIFSVILVHSGGFVGWFLHQKSFTYLPILSDITSAGRYGVQLFFVISGFLISYLYEREPHTETAWRREYLRRRLARVYPLWLVFLAINVCLAFTPLKNLSSIDALTSDSPNRAWAVIMIVLMGATFTLWLSPALWNTVIGGGWSIQAEVVHYLAFLGLRNASARKLLWVTVALQAAGFGAGLSATFLKPSVFTEITAALTRLSVFNSLLYFILGIFANRVISKVDSQARTADFAGCAFPGAISALLLLVLPGSLIDNFPKIGFIVTAFALAYFSKEIERINSLMSSVARVSYSMYFVHFFVLGALGILLTGVGPLPAVSDGLLDVSLLVATFILVALSTFMISKLTYRFIEKPANAWAHARRSKRAAQLVE